MLRFVGLVTLLVACGAGSPDAKTTSSNWHPSTGDEGSVLTIRIDPGTTWKDATAKIVGDMCPDAILVWGDLVVDESVRPRTVVVDFGGGKIKGWLVCNDVHGSVPEIADDEPALQSGARRER